MATAKRSKPKKKFQSGGSVSSPSILDRLYQARYGVTSGEKIRMADAGQAPGFNAEAAATDPTGADRALSAYLAAKKHGPFAAVAGQGLRNDLLLPMVDFFAPGEGAFKPGSRTFTEKFYGETPARKQQMNKAVFNSAVQAVVDKNLQGKATPRPPRFNQGGPVPKSNSFLRIPAKDMLKMATGGVLPSVTQGAGNPLSSQQPATSNVVGQTIGAINTIQPNTGALTATAGQLAGFNPLSGAAGGTLQNIVANGAPVDVNPITQVAQAQADRSFQDFAGGANEQFGALGLGSSSARTASLARERGRLQQGVGETGILAGVQAQTDARNRQLAAFNPLLQGSGQQLAGLQSSGQLQGDVAQLGLQGQVAKAGQFNNLSGTLVPPTVGVNQGPQPGGGGPGTFFGGGGAGAGAPRPPNRQLGRTGVGSSSFAQGGRVDLGDFLGNLTFGQQFTRPDAKQFQGFRGGAPRQQGRTPPSGGSFFSNVPTGSNVNSNRRDLLALLSNMGGDVGSALGRRPVGPSQSLNAGMNIAGQHSLPFLLSAFGGGQEEGGVIDGPSQPPDQVPILAQGGEGVIPLGLMDELAADQSGNPLVRKLQKLMEMPQGPSKTTIQRKERGGKIARVMGEFKRGALRSSSGDAVTDRKQAIAIALSEARRAGQAAPPEMQTGGKVPEHLKPFLTARETKLVESGLDAGSGTSLGLLDEADALFKEANRGTGAGDTVTQFFQKLKGGAKNTASKVGSAASKAGTLSADFLLDPMMNLIYSQPEGKKLLQELGFVPPEPRQFAHGGQVAPIPTDRQQVSQFRGATDPSQVDPLEAIGSANLRDPSGRTFASVQSQGQQTPSFTVPSAGPENPDDFKLRQAEDAAKMAQARSNFMKALALKISREAPNTLPKIAPHIASAEADELTANEVVKNLQTQRATVQAQQAERQFTSGQNALARQGSLDVAGVNNVADLEQSRIMAGSRDPFAGLGGAPGEGGPPPAPSPPPPPAAPGRLTPEQLAQGASPESQAAAQQFRAQQAQEAESQSQVENVRNALAEAQALGYPIPLERRKEILASVGLTPEGEDTLQVLQTGDPDQIEDLLVGRQLGFTPETQVMAEEMLNQIMASGKRFERIKEEYPALLRLANGIP